MADYVKHKQFGNIGRVHQTFERTSKANGMHDVEVVSSVNLRSYDPNYLTYEGPNYWFGENTEPSTEEAYDAQLDSVRKRLSKRK